MWLLFTHGKNHLNDPSFRGHFLDILSLDIVARLSKELQKPHTQCADSSLSHNWLLQLLYATESMHNLGIHIMYCCICAYFLRLHKDCMRRLGPFIFLLCFDAKSKAEFWMFGMC